jgi:hypothetical protein
VDVDLGDVCVNNVELDEDLARSLMQSYSLTLMFGSMMPNSVKVVALLILVRRELPAVTDRAHSFLCFACHVYIHQHTLGARTCLSLVEKRPSVRPFSPQLIWSAANGHISPGSIENVGQRALVPVQMCPLVLVCATNQD